MSKDINRIFEMRKKEINLALDSNYNTTCISYVLPPAYTGFRCKSNPTKKRSDNLIELLRDIKERKEEVADHRCKNKLRTVIVQHGISEGAYSNVYPHGPKAGVLYGLPKIHQAGVPVRPIISAIEFKGILPY